MENYIEKQLKLREETDNGYVSTIVDAIANAVMGKNLKSFLSSDEVAESAIDEIFKYYNIKKIHNELPINITTLEERIEYIMRPHGIKSRVVELDNDWYKVAVGAMIGTLKEDGSLVALIPSKIYGYNLIDFRNDKKVKINKKINELIEKEAICFYEPLPLKPLKVTDLLVFMFKQLSVFDIFLYFIFVLISVSLGLVLPYITKTLFGNVLIYGNLRVLLSLFIFATCFSISNLFFNAFNSLVTSRISIKQDIAVKAAIMNRVISLPISFFKKHSSAELSERISYIEDLCKTLFGTVGLTSITSLFSLVYIGQIFVYTPALVIPSIIIIVISTIFSIVSTFIQIKITKQKMEQSVKVGSLTYAAISGMQKVKLAGFEKRMFSGWGEQYAQLADIEYNPPIFLKLNGSINLIISLFGTIIIYVAAINSGIMVSDYYAFDTAYGMVAAAFMSFASIVTNIASIKPTLEMSKPIMDTKPETHDNKENITELSGNVELEHVSFKYEDMDTSVIDDLSLKIKSGEYVAIVGETGCGKSTILRLLLGFETPQKGVVLYDNKDISKIDHESLRKKIGVVMQDGKLFLGDIYSNIVITAPELSIDRAWEAAKIASIDEDISAMPMGMHTIISEGQGGISGGQRQRIMIARAIVHKPKILMLDEATNALDNVTQKKVSDAIDSLNCTRIVIAHRLSTIQHADRIICIDKGKIAEEGTYEELMNKKGIFYSLVERQKL